MKKQHIKKKNLILFIIIALVLAIALIGVLGVTVTLRNFVLNGDDEISVALGDEFVDPGVKTRFADASGTVNTDMTGDYTITYTLMGRTLIRTVHVLEDADRFVVGLRGSDTQIVLQGEPYIENGAYVVDTVSSEEGGLGAVDESEIEISGDVDTSVPGDYEVTYKYTLDNTTYETSRKVKVETSAEFGNETESVTVLMYHWVYTADDVPSNLTSNWILDTDLEQQLKYLSENDYYYPGWAELRAWIDDEIELPKRSVILTFNDGKKAFFKNGLPLLESYEIPATVFLTCSEENKGQEKVTKYASKYLEFESQSYDMHRAGKVSGYRSVIAAMSQEEIKSDLEKAQSIVGNNEAFAYPYGEYTSDALAAVEEQGYKVAFTTTYGRIYKGMDPYKLPRTRVTGDTDFELWRESVSKP